jgi:HIRAN domain
MSQDTTLFVGWQDQGDRRWYVVARLVGSSRDTGEHDYSFEYVRGAQEAASKGFRPFVAFPDLSEIVRSRTLLPFFRNRVMPSSRPDYPSYLTQLGLSTVAGELDILARSGGRRTTEREEIEVFAPPVLRNDGTYETHFFVRGLRYLGAKSSDVVELHEHDSLLCMLDLQNPFNHNAVLLRTKNQLVLGYVPDFLCQDVATLLRNGNIVRVDIVKVNDISVPVQHRVLCRMQLEPPADYLFLSTSKFEPMVERGVSRAA